MNFVLVSNPSPGVRRVTSEFRGRPMLAQLWGRVQARKDGICAATGQAFAHGDSVYRPLGPCGNAQLRVIASAWDA